MKYYKLKSYFIGFILICLFLLSSCFQKNTKGYEIVEEKYNSGITFMKFEFNFERNLDSINGMEVKFQIDYPTMSNDPLKKYGEACNSLQICMFLLDEKGAKIKANKSDGDSISEPFVCQEYNTRDKYDEKVNAFFPFYKNSTKDGLHDFYLLIEAYPTNRTKDTALYSTKYISKRLSTKPDIMVKLKFRFNQPKVNKYAIKVNGFELDTTKFNPHSCDFALFGSGYPDPFWSINAVNNYFFSSPTFTNILKYDSVYTSGNFYLSEKDKMLLYASDWDSFSRNDALGSMYFKPSDISHDINKPSILKFGWVKDFKITAIQK